MSKRIYITQSLLKSLYDYRMGEECGLVFEKKFIDGKFDLFPPSDVQNIGAWFEYEATGSMPKNNVIPEPERVKSGEFTAPYKKMISHVSHFKMFMSYYGIEIVEKGYDLVVNGLKGTLDLLCRATKDIYDSNGALQVRSGGLFIIDIKTTGLLDDKWNPYGWNLETLHQKHRIILQPIHYRFIAQLQYGERLPFMFLLFSNTNENDYRAFFFDVTDEDIEHHKEFILKSTKWLKYYIEKGFQAHPDVLRCANCPIKSGCKHFMPIPKIGYFLLTNPNN